MDCGDLETGASNVVRRRIVEVALALAIAILAFATVRSSLARPSYDRMADFSVYLGSAKAVFTGHSLYSYAAPNGDPFTYPPVAVLPFLALVKAPLLLARLIWQAVCLISVALIAVTLVRRWPTPVRSPWRMGLLAGFAMLVSAPVQSDLRFGQISVVIVAMAFIDAAEVTPTRSRGLLIGLAAAIKLTPLLFVVYLLLARRWRDAGRAVGAFVAATAFCWLLMPADSRQFFTGTGISVQRVGDLAALGNQSLNGLLLRAGIPSPARPVVWLALVAAVVSIGLAHAVALRRAGKLAPAAALVGCATLAASPVSWTHHQLWSVLAAMLLLSADGLLRRALGVAGLAVMSFSILDAADTFTSNNGILFLAANARTLFACTVCVVGFAAFGWRPGGYTTAPRVARIRKSAPRMIIGAVAALAAFALIPLPEQLAQTIRPATLDQLASTQSQLSVNGNRTTVSLSGQALVNYDADATRSYIEGGVYRTVARLQALAAPGGEPVNVPILRQPDGDGVFAVHYSDGTYLQLRALDSGGKLLGEFGDKVRH